MTSTATNVEDAPPSPGQAETNFPVEARVILQGLLKAPDLNGKKGVVRSVLSSAGRHIVYIKALDKIVGLKPSNLRYEPISLKSLTAKELKMVLKYKNQEPSDTTGMEKSDLQARVSKLIDDSSEELPELLASAKAKAGADDSVSTTASHSQAADQLGNISPDQLRQQARMMKTMDPTTLRRMNPQFANMTDSQLKMAADRMEKMANDPSMMKAAAEQMKNMDSAQLQKMQAQMGGGAGVPAPSVNQAQQAAQMMQNMNPKQLRQQAQMLKTTDPDTLRRTNPQLAHMSDSQIKMAAIQFEMMASNPSMMKMAMDQMNNATPEQLEAMSKGQIPSQGGLGSSSEPTGMPQMGGDPAEMLSNIDTAQLKEMLNTVKDNPEMMKQYAGMVGISEDQLKQGMESFGGMDDIKIDAVLKVMKYGQKAKKTWDGVDAKAGGHLKIITIAIVVLVMAWIVRYFFFTAQSGSSTIESTTAFFEDQTYAATGDDLETEF
jgi:hypothetical protein